MGRRKGRRKGRRMGRRRGSRKGRRKGRRRGRSKVRRMGRRMGRRAKMANRSPMGILGRTEVMTDNNHTTCPTCEKQFHDMDTLDGKICFSCATDALAAARNEVDQLARQNELLTDALAAADQLAVAGVDAQSAIPACGCDRCRKLRRAFKAALTAYRKTRPTDE
jgi:hypothetical protein